MENIQKTTISTHSRLVKASIVIAIVIVMNLFFNYVVSLVYSEPVYDQFVKPTQVVENISTKEKCLAIGGQWNENNYQTPQVASPKGTSPIQGYCDPNYTNQKNYDNAIKIYDRNVFITLVSVGVVAIAIGSFINISILAISFVWGGVLSLVIASIRYWSSADNLVKVIILAIALVSLIWLAIKKFSK
ncbi:MAG TPA: hypothetical protein VMR49_03890 [Candidatus Paceibacterota bacterium]|jgi:hypothetical protein|nr:hypothetical protein [Candidatus Paceibacterota bacterium]